MKFDAPNVDFGCRHRLISHLRDINVPGIRLVSRAIPRLILPSPHGPVRLRTIHGFDLYIEPAEDRGVERALYETGTYEKGTLVLLMGFLEKGSSCVDVGANIGLMTVAMARIVGAQGKVFAIEPNPAAREILQYNIEINQLENVSVLPYAIGSNSTQATMYDGVDGNRGRASLLAFGGTEIGVVQIRTLAEVIPADVKIDLVKVDVEGYELNVLKGMSSLLERQYSPALIVEFSKDRDDKTSSTSRELFEHIRALGCYRLFCGAAGKERTSKLIEIASFEDLPDHDNVFCLADEHVERARSKGLMR